MYHHHKWPPAWVFSFYELYRCMLWRVSPYQLSLWITNLKSLWSCFRHQHQQHSCARACRGDWKEDTCCQGTSMGIISTLPYNTLPWQLVIYLLHFVIMWLNNFPVANGTSTRWSPREIILRHCLDYTHRSCHAPFWCLLWSSRREYSHKWHDYLQDPWHLLRSNRKLPRHVKLFQSCHRTSHQRLPLWWTPCSWCCHCTGLWTCK